MSGLIHLEFFPIDRGFVETMGMVLLPVMLADEPAELPGAEEDEVRTDAWDEGRSGSAGSCFGSVREGNAVLSGDELISSSVGDAGGERVDGDVGSSEASAQLFMCRFFFAYYNSSFLNINTNFSESQIFHL